MSARLTFAAAIAASFFFTALTTATAVAEFLLETTASYESNPNAHIATGGAFADMDGDGWIDMVVANGNDITRQRLSIYHNNGDGTFPLDPTWESDDIDYNGHLDIGDVNGDGFLDVAVSVYIGAAGFSEPGHVKLYLGTLDGHPTANPVWISDPIYSFSCAFGDADGDGDLDLAVACGESYNELPERQRIFYNVNGEFDAVAPWQSDEVAYALDVTWGDIDEDGDMDVVFCGASTPMRIYENQQTTGGGIATTATWQSTDAPQYGNTTAFGDWNGDGFPELAVADNFQLGGNGYFKVYANTNGEFATTPEWESSSGGYGSHVSWADLDTDGDVDLIVGGWWDRMRIFENLGGTLTLSPVWTSDVSSVIENIFWGDVDNDALFDNGGSRASGDGFRTHFPIGQSPIRSVDEIRIDGVPVAPGQYCTHLGNGWISFATPPAVGAGVEIYFSYSADLDAGITTWDSARGNYVHLNLNTTTSVPEVEAAFASLRAMPNPVRGRTQIRYEGPALVNARLEIFDTEGRHINSLHEGTVNEGLQIWEWNRTNEQGHRTGSGVYFARLAAPSGSRTLRLIVVD